MIVELRRPDARYRDLTPRQPYVVMGIEGGDSRILNDSGRPYLYPERLFRILDSREPGDWITEFGEKRRAVLLSAGPQFYGIFRGFPRPEAKAVATFWRVLNRRLAAVGKVS